MAFEYELDSRSLWRVLSAPTLSSGLIFHMWYENAKPAAEIYLSMKFRVITYEHHSPANYSR